MRRRRSLACQVPLPARCRKVPLVRFPSPCRPNGNPDIILQLLQAAVAPPPCHPSLPARTTCPRSLHLAACPSLRLPASSPSRLLDKAVVPRQASPGCHHPPAARASPVAAHRQDTTLGLLRRGMTGGKSLNSCTIDKSGWGPYTGGRAMYDRNIAMFLQNGVQARNG